MRFQTPTAILVLFLALAAAEAQDKVAPEVPVESPQGQLALAVNDLAVNVRVEDAPFTKYLSFITVPKDQRDSFRRVFRWWFNHTNGSRGLVEERPITASNGTLIKIDIRQAINWTRAAWEVVGNRDYLFREPWLPHRETEFLRLATGVKQDPKTLAACSLMNAFQLFRDGMDGNRSTTYYDLLYASERFPDGDLQFQVVPKPVEIGPAPERPPEVLWEGGVWPLDGKEYPAGSFKYTKKSAFEKWEKDLAAWEAAKADNARIIPARNTPGKGEKNFPAKGADFEKRWGGDVSPEDIKKFLVDPRFGGIAVGSENDPKAGSFVALNDRAIRITASKLVQGGWVARTFDVTENTGDRDHMERVIQIAQGDIKSDAGELLATLPNGAQAAMLVDGNDSRVEIANTAAAQIRGGKIDKFVDVHTHMSCLVCHGQNNGFIPFSEAVQESIKKGLQAKTIDEKLGTQVRDFYTKWERAVRGMQDPYLFYTSDATATKDDPKGWTGPTAVKQFQASRDWYDLPVTPEIAAMEFGMTAATLKKLLLDLSQGRGGVRESIKTRVNQLAVGQSIPRRTWEVDTSQEIGLILSSVKNPEEPIKNLVAPQLLEDAVKRFSKGVIQK